MEIDYLTSCRLQSYRYYFPQFNVEKVLNEDKSPDEQDLYDEPNYNNPPKPQNNLHKNNHPIFVKNP